MRAFFRGPMPFLCVGHSFDHMFILLFSVVVLEVEREFGLSFNEGVRLAWLGLVLFGLGAPFAGWLADKWSDIGMFAVFLVGIGLSTMGAGLAQTPDQMFVALTCIGLFASIYHPVGIPDGDARRRVKERPDVGRERRIRQLRHGASPAASQH